MTTGSPTSEVVELIELLNEEIELQGDCFRSKTRYPGCPGLLERSATLLQSLEARIEDLEGALKSIITNARLPNGVSHHSRRVTVLAQDYQKARAALTPSNRDRM